MVITAVHMWGFVQPGHLRSLHSNMSCSMPSKTTTRAKLQKPAVSVNRGLGNKTLFFLEASLSLLSSYIRRRQKEKQDMIPLMVVVYPIRTLLCCMDKIQRRPNPSPSGSLPLSPRHSPVAAPQLKAFLQGFQWGPRGEMFLGSSSKQRCCTLVPTSPSACSPFSVFGPRTSGWLSPSSSSLWLAEKTGEEEEGGTWGTKCPTKTLPCLPAAISSHPGGDCISMENDIPAGYRFHTYLLCREDEEVSYLWPAESSSEKSFTSLGAVTEQTWNPTPLHCCCLTFTVTATQLLVHSQAFLVGLLKYILAFERCQSAKI